jgi:hypothetical protein
VRAGERIGASHLHLCRAEALRGGGNRGHAAGMLFDQQHRGRAARGRFQPECAAACVEIEHAQTGERLAEPVEHGLAHPVWRGAQARQIGHGEFAAFPQPANDADFTAMGAAGAGGRVWGAMAWRLGIHGQVNCRSLSCIILFSFLRSAVHVPLFQTQIRSRNRRARGDGRGCA